MLDHDDYASFRVAHRTLYHVVYDADLERRASIMEHGLVTGAPTRHNWHGLWKPRQHHTYLACAWHLKRVTGWGNSTLPIDVFAVEASALAPPAITADEDWFVPWNAHDNGELNTAYAIKGKPAHAHFRLPFPSSNWLWQASDDHGLPQLGSFGEWADAIGLGNDSAHTRYSLRCGSVAYGGDISPSALRLVHSTITETPEPC